MRARSVSTHGHRLDAAALAQIEPGQSAQGDVVQLLGSPSSLATFDDHTWYYVSQRTERHSFYHTTSSRRTWWRSSSMSRGR